VSGQPGHIAWLYRSGGPLTGFLTLHADPTAALHAATKQYADAREAAAIASVVDVLEGTGNTVTVVNTTAETVLYSGTIPAGTLGTARGVRLALHGDYLNNSAGAQTFTLRVRFGPTTLTGTIITSAASSLAVSVTPRRLRVLVELHSKNTTANHTGYAELWVSGATADGVGEPLSGMNVHSVGWHLNLTVSSLVATLLEVTAQHGAAEGTIVARKYTTQMEVLR